MEKEKREHNHTAYEKALESSSFCIYPFTHLATKTEGTFKLCCRSEPMSDVNVTSAIDLWNSEEYKEIRRKMLNNEKPSQCQDCWALESIGTRSMRQRALRNFPGSRWSSYSALLKNVSEDGHVPFLPKSIELKLSNLCNLKCRMCHAVDSSSWVQDWPLVSDLMKQYNQWAYKSAEQQNVLKKPLISGFENSEQWWKDFEKMVDSVELIEFAGGEPLMDPLHYRILDLLERRASEIRLKYSTNLTHLGLKGKNVFDLWKKFKSISIYGSVDGVYEVYDYIRTGSNFFKIEKNMDLIIENKEINFDEIAVACTIQIYNLFNLPDMIEYFSQKGVKFHSHRVTAPTFLSTQVLPQEIKEQAEKDIRNYQNKINTEQRFPKPVLANINRHIEDHVSHMTGRDLTHLIPAFVEYTNRLDIKRDTKLQSIVPQLAPLFK